MEAGKLQPEHSSRELEAEGPTVDEKSQDQYELTPTGPGVVRLLNSIRIPAGY